MALNERYRERLDIGADAVAAGAPYLASATSGLNELQSRGHITSDAVREVLRDSGLPAEAIQTSGGDGAVDFGGLMPPEVGGPGVAVCLFGEVSTDRVSVEVGGIILDGGCLAMQGH